MIPINLTLKNFMSYGPQSETLAFEGMHVACLSGDNGSGKSALLDAITWALWGRTRVSSTGSTSDDDLIRSGEEEMEVRFEFELNGERYRVVRRRRRGRSATSDWQFAQQRSSDTNFESIGGGTQKETGRLIAELLSMEYETFLNSAYLQQGKADEFTRQTPGKRKAILGEILGLERYDQLESRARELWRDRKDQIAEIDSQIAMLDAQIARKAGFQAELEAAQKEDGEHQKLLIEADRVQQELRERKSRLDVLADSLAERRATLGRAEADIARRDAERCARADRIRLLEETLAQRASIEADYALYQSALKRRNELDPEIDRLNTISREIDGISAHILADENRLRSELRAADIAREAVVRRQSRHAALSVQVTEISSRFADDIDYEAESAQAESDLQRIRDEFSELRSRNDSVKKSISEVDEILEILGKPMATCPVCESDLADERRNAVISRQTAKLTNLHVELSSLLNLGRLKKADLDKAQETATAARERLSERVATTARLAELVNQRAVLEQEGIDVSAASNVVEQLRRTLDTQAFAQSKRIQRMQLEKDIERLSALKIEHDSVRATTSRLAGTDRRFHQLQEASPTLAREWADQEQAIVGIAERRREADALRIETDALQRDLAEYDTVVDQAGKAEASKRALQAEADVIRSREGALRAYIQSCDEAERERKERKALHNKLDRERWAYSHLVSAFGKKGVQALIIENAIPDLEIEANELLARMTDSAMEVRFETTRAAKSGGHEIETLDIRVQDAYGVRPYELFSGGEAFRVNFSIRIALSRLLARRSGAKLQTLILDEGFGTQDGKGREKLVEAIDTIKDDFHKILVITHVDELKDAFPQRIEISRDSAGSHIHIL